MGLSRGLLGVQTIAHMVLLQSKLLKGGCVEDIQESIIGVIKGDARSSYYGLHELQSMLILSGDEQWTRGSVL